MGLSELILSQEDRKTTTVEIPEWKDENGNPVVVTLIEMTAQDRDEIENEFIKAHRAGKVKAENMRALIAARIIVDDKKQRVFSDAQVPMLAQKNAKALERIFDAHLAINKLTQEEADEYEKNSP